MDVMNRNSAARAAAHRHPSLPRQKIVAAVERAETDGVVTALGAAGFARDRIEVITAKDVPELDEPIGGSGLRGLLSRLSLSMGADLDAIEEARQELAYGHVLVLVLARRGLEQDRARAVLRARGGHAMRSIGRWTITTLDGDAD